MTYPSGRPTDDAVAMMRYDANKKSVIVTYLLWFFLGWFGGHYARSTREIGHSVSDAVLSANVSVGRRWEVARRSPLPPGSHGYRRIHRS